MLKHMASPSAFFQPLQKAATFTHAAAVLDETWQPWPSDVRCKPGRVLEGAVFQVADVDQRFHDRTVSPMLGPRKCGSCAEIGCGLGLRSCLGGAAIESTARSRGWRWWIALDSTWAWLRCSRWATGSMCFFSRRPPWRSGLSGSSFMTSTFFCIIGVRFCLTSGKQKCILVCNPMKTQQPGFWLTLTRSTEVPQKCHHFDRSAYLHPQLEGEKNWTKLGFAGQRLRPETHGPCWGRAAGP
jgi:hypothetical protein